MGILFASNTSLYVLFNVRHELVGLVFQHILQRARLHLVHVLNLSLVVEVVQDVVHVSRQEVPPLVVNRVHGLTHVNHVHSPVMHTTRDSSHTPLQEVVLAEVPVNQSALLEHVAQQLQGLDEQLLVQVW